MYYITRGLEILQKKGFRGLSEEMWDFLMYKLDPKSEYIATKLRFDYQNYKNYVHSALRFDAPAEPYRTITIRPSKVNERIYHRVHKNNQYAKRRDFELQPIEKAGLGRVRGGDWDKDRYQKPVEQIPKINGIQERFQENVDWKETEYYKYFYRRFTSKNRHRKAGYEAVEECVLDMCKNVESLYESIKSNGYTSGHTGPRCSGEFGIREKLEVLVTIGRNGEIYLWDGQHRFAIARVLDIKIPAHVVCRHKQWQQVRDSVSNNGAFKIQERLRQHPDLQDIRS